MQLHELKPAAGSRTKRKRVGRGIASGHGKTAGRGQKGQGARSGGTKGPHFEGGQTPLYRRMPKRGFTRGRFAVRQAVVNLKDLAARFESGETVTLEKLVEKGLVQPAEERVKVLGEGEAPANLTVQAHAFSKEAARKIEAAGGKAEVV